MGNYTRTDYHDRQPTWRDSFYSKGSYVGIELECESTSTYVSLLRSLPELRGRCRPLVERDGSLDHISGVELVFPPFLLSTLKKNTSTIAKVMESLKGKTRDTNTAGMHVNINCIHWEVKKIENFVSLLHNVPATFLANIGQRPLNRYCEQTRSVSPYQSLHGHRDRHAVERRNGRIEVRFPRTTTDHARLVNLLTFLNMAEKFVESKFYVSPKPEARQRWDYKETTSAFVKWMKRTPKRKAILKILNNGY